MNECLDFLRGREPVQQQERPWLPLQLAFLKRSVPLALLILSDVLVSAGLEKGSSCISEDEQPQPPILVPDVH